MTAAAAPPLPSPPPAKQPLFKPAIILHGGAGNIQRSRLPPELYTRFHSSLLTYLRSTYELLNSTPTTTNAPDGAVAANTALDAAVHAVSLMEDDELFNCGRGSVFTSAGTIEMEASVMVSSLIRGTEEGGEEEGFVKRGAGVMLVKNVRHPIRLAKEVLVRTGYNDDSGGDGGNMHSQLSGPYVEELAREWGLEIMPDEWFWTKKRWEDHKRGLEKGKKGKGNNVVVQLDVVADEEDTVYLSQGTVGCVCLDRWGNLAVATSTGGLTNKVPGRIGDTPTLGAGFWAEGWDVEGSDGMVELLVRDGYQPSSVMYHQPAIDVPSATLPSSSSGSKRFFLALRDCLSRSPPPPPSYDSIHTRPKTTLPLERPLVKSNLPTRTKRRAVALSGTGNGDSFLRTNAARTAAAMARFSPVSLTNAVSAVSGPNGELQRSAGSRWGKTLEGEGGLIGIEAEMDLEDVDVKKKGKNTATELRRAKVVSDFNCGGMFRAWIEEGSDGEDVERVMVFRDEYA
ncbi:hypothetical protein AJ80_09329 [Polytolypa hystricis UAMH7299]|uniref:Asparaginase n=1 Tax=Polytolypa hystricis (strain UAMH7299) TaxID=1447883 RepID=A0A2B7WSH3_POLH7|nr:hypothetical protein AJ80_09329 [Polytolypa hystricis UAMH7299]